MGISNPFSLTVAATPVSRHTAQAPDLDALAAIVRDGHRAVGLAARDVFEHAVKAGARAARGQGAGSGHGKWLPWLRRSCEISERQAQRYMEIARSSRTSWLASPTRVSDLSLRGLKRLLKPPADRAPPVRRRPAGQKPLGKLDSARGRSVGSILRRSKSSSACSIPSGRAQSRLRRRPPGGKTISGPASAGEIARLNARVEELQREVRQRDLTIAGLRRELGMPVDDGLDIPTFLRRLPPPDALESIEAEARDPHDGDRLRAPHLATRFNLGA